MRVRRRINWDVVFTLVVLIMLYAIAAGIIYFTLVGIKYTLDDAVHVGVVDSIVCCVVPYYIVRWIYHIDQKLGKDGKFA